MTLTLNQDVYSHKNELQAKEGDKVELISDAHWPVLLVSVFRGNTENRFPVRYTGTNYQELKDKENE